MQCCTVRSGMRPKVAAPRLPRSSEMGAIGGMLFTFGVVDLTPSTCTSPKGCQPAPAPESAMGLPNSARKAIIQDRPSADVLRVRASDDCAPVQSHAFQLWKYDSKVAESIVPVVGGPQ